MRLIVAALVVATVFLFAVPPLWPEPRVRLEITGPDRDVAAVTIESWHTNVEVHQVYVVGGGESWTMPRPETTPWSRWRLDRLTWPRTWTERFEIPSLEGTEATVHVGIRYPSVSPFRIVGQPYPVRTRHLVVPTRREGSGRAAPLP